MKHTHNDAEHQRLAEHSKLLLQSLRVDIELAESRYFLQEPINANDERQEALAERLWHRDSIKILVITLELRGRAVGNNQRDDIANDRREVAPIEVLVENEVDHSADKGEMPIVPEVDVHRACSFCKQHQQVYTQANGDNEHTHGRVVSHGCCGWPSHIKHLEVEVIDA